ncbi:MAG: signal recognition particle subunit [Thermococcaceae archaeon]|nr:signal recognition particle subunit [Thermococcaceae archaeon]
MAKFVVWPCELDSRLGRKYGRLVRKDLAVDNPSIDEIIEAAESAGIKVVEVEREKMNPRLSALEEEYRTRGMLRVDSPHGKAKTLRILAQKVREIRKNRNKPSGKKHGHKRKRRR